MVDNTKLVLKVDTMCKKTFRFECVYFNGAGLVSAAWRWRNWDMTLHFGVKPKYLCDLWFHWWQREPGIDIVMYTMLCGPLFMLCAMYWEEKDIS